MNAYFIENPQRVLGEPVVGNGMYGSATLTVRNENLGSVPEQLHDQLQAVARTALEGGRGVAARQEGQVIEAAAIVPAGSDLQVGHISAQPDGTFTQVGLDGAVASLKVPKTQERELRSLLRLRDLARSVLSLEASNVEDAAELETERERLRGTYRTYVDTYGPYRRTAAVVAAGNIPAPDSPMVAAADDSFYFRRDDDGLLISPAETVSSVPEDAQPRPEDLQALISRLDAMTTLGIGSVLRAWTGLRTQVADGLPVVGFDPEVEGFFWLAGQGGYGFQTSSAIAELAAGQITGTGAGSGAYQVIASALSAAR